jgi:signal transduction histidine kinase
MAVVAVALVAGAVLLVVLQRDALRDSAQTSAEHRAEDLAQQVETDGVPSRLGEIDDDGPDEDVLLQVADADGEVLVTSGRQLPTDDAGEVDGYAVGVEDTDDYVVTVAVSLEDAEESTAALVPLLLVGVPLLVLVVGATTWLVVTRALRPVERIRAEVAAIGEQALDRRVPVPESHDEVHRLAVTMNDMLGRLEAAQLRQRRFVSDASHELRTPLAVLRQTGEVSRAHPGAMPPEELAETVVEESTRMQRLVEQLLVLARSDEGRLVAERRDVDLDDLLLAEAGRARAAGLTVDTTGVAAGRVRGDAGAIAQVVRNLVDNAVRHAAGRLRLALTEQDGGVTVAVEDDGPGVPEAERERVFERFVRLDEARARDDGGSGLGLAIVREIARLHGGDAVIEGSDLGGARVVVRLAR